MPTVGNQFKTFIYTIGVGVYLAFKADNVKLVATSLNSNISMKTAHVAVKLGSPLLRHPD